METIDAALTGMPDDASVAQLSQAITAALDDSVAMIGFSPEAVGIAIRRALGRASGWLDHTFDVIDAMPMRPVMHVALDEVSGLTKCRDAVPRRGQSGRAKLERLLRSEMQ